jgi:hypothetical protein
MRIKLGIALSSAVGTMIYEALKHGFQHIDWTRVAMVTVLTFLLILFIPARVFEKKKTPVS